VKINLRHHPKTLLALVFILAGVTATWFLFRVSKKPKAPVLVRLSWDTIDTPITLQRRDLVISGLSKSILLLKDSIKGDKLTVSGLPVSRQALLSSLMRLKALIENASSPDALLQSLKKEFIPYEIRNGLEANDKPILVTGYFQPRFKGSYKATKDYAFPVYGWPPDLIKVNLKRFSPSLPPKNLWGRISGRQLVPYYSRKDIETKRPLPEKLAICWLSSPVDVLELQIQGSAIIDIEGGPSRYIHYAASNGLCYKSIGKVLIQRGLLRPEGLDWPVIRKWAEKHPERFQQVLFENPRYIFFKWEKRGPVGCYGQVLVPGTSAALDPSVYPPGIAAFLTIKWPRIADGPEWFKNRPKTLLVVNHDKGSAIKGPFRLDLYCGSGEAAGFLAGRLKNRARLIILLERSMKLEN